MAKISELASGGDILDTDELVALRAGGNVRVQVAGLATQDPSSISITGGSINGTTIGATTAAAGTFTQVNFGDNAKAVFGAGSDLEIYHHPTDGSYIVDNGTGNLQIDANDFRVRKPDGSEAMIHANADGAVKLFYDGGATPKLATTSTGIDVTGTVTADGVNIDGTGSTSSEQLLTLVNVGGAAGAGSRIWISGTNSTTRGVYIEGQAQSTGNDHDLIFATSAVSAAPVERMRIDSSGNVGIGTASPGRLLEVNTDGEAFIRLRSSDSGNAGFEFGDQSDSVQGAIFMNASDNSLRFNGFDNAEAMRIDSAGNLLVGKTAVDTNTAGFEARSTGFIGVTRADVGAYFTRLTTDGEIIQFRKDSTTVGSIGTFGSDLYIGTNDSGLRFEYAGLDAIVPFDVNSSTVSDAATDLGNGSARFKDLYLSGGVYLGGTGASNQLDDYEEGTWTPVAKSGSTTITTTNNIATYTKIGRFVFIQGHITRNDAASLTDVLSIASLPFNTQSGNVSVNGGFWIDGTGTDEVCTGYFPSDSSSMTIKKVGASSDYATADQFQNGRPIYFSAAYMTAT